MERKEVMKLKVSEIKINNRFRKDVGNLRSLIESIKDVGLLHPVVVSENNELVAGYRRIRAFEELGIDEVPVTVVNFDVLRRGEIEENLVRKDFTASEMVAIKRFYEAEVKTEAKESQGTRTDLGKQHSGKFPQGSKSRDVLGGFVGVSGKTLQKAEEIIEAAEENPKFAKLVSKMDNGEISINAAAIQVRRAKKHSNTPELPEGKYDVIYADPPWKYEFCLEGDPKEHYAEMPTQDICDLQIPAADNAILFLWVTNPKIEDALKVIKAWKFKYITNIVWVKQTKGLGYYTLAQHELLFVCKKGDIPPPQAETRIASVVQADRTNHSKKPEIFYEIIEHMYPNRKYLELFARTERNNWKVWGNQLEG